MKKPAPKTDNRIKRQRSLSTRSVRPADLSSSIVRLWVWLNRLTTVGARTLWSCQDRSTSVLWRRWMKIGERLKKLYVAAEHARPHEILFRQFPQLFPSDAVRLQIGGVDGQPLFPAGENAFTVKLELHVPEPGSANKIEPEKQLAKQRRKPLPEVVRRGLTIGAEERSRSRR